MSQSFSKMRLYFKKRHFDRMELWSREKLPGYDLHKLWREEISRMSRVIGNWINTQKKGIIKQDAYY